jgi:hypothetical protein
MDGGREGGREGGVGEEGEGRDQQLFLFQQQPSPPLLSPLRVFVFVCVRACLPHTVCGGREGGGEKPRLLEMD